MNDAPLPHLAFPGVTWQALAAECSRELEARRRFYPGRVAKGNMTQADADREIALALAWDLDVARIRYAWIERWTGTISPRAQAPRTAHPSWRERREALRRELELRGRIYPRDVDSGKLLEADARRQLDALACLLAIYEDGWDWTGSDGQLPGKSAIAAEEFTALRAEIDAREGRSQHALAL